MDIYSNKSNLRIGFHGYSKSVRDGLVNNPNQIKVSTDSYDWLGTGFYLWENNLSRAEEWDKEKQERDNSFNPTVVGVIYQLGYCLDFAQ